MMKKFLATLAAVTLSTAALWGVATPAFADETTDSAATDATTQIVGDTVVSEPVAEPAAEEPPAAEVPAEEPAPSEPVAEEAPAEPVVEEPPSGEAPGASESDSVDPLAGSILSLTPLIAPAAAPENPDKVYVCKIVASENSPGGFRLQTGQNPIYVSVNALGDDVNDTGTFNDQQPSFIVPSNDVSLCAHQDVIVEEEVICPEDEEDLGVVNITTTTKYYLGSTLVDTVVEHSIRPLTEEELAACDTGELVASASVSITPATCDTGEKLVLGTAVNATWGDVTDPAGSDEYSVTATANVGAKFAGDLESVTFTGDLAGPIDPLDPECELPTQAEVLASASATNQTCSASGTINVVLAEHVLYFLDGLPLAAASTPKAPGAYVVTAEPESEEYTIIDTKEWPLTITAATGCAVVLASTGATTSFAGLWLGGGFLVLGSAVFYLRRRFGATTK